MINIQSGIEQTLTGLRLIVRGIDGKTGGPLLLGTIPNNGRVLVPTRIFVGLVVGTGITTPPSISIGTNGAAYDNLVANVALTGLSQGNLAPATLRAQYPWLTAGMQAFLNINTPGAAPGPITLALLALGEWL